MLAVATALVLVLTGQVPAVDVDARIRLGAALTREGKWAEALQVLEPLEERAGDNADLLAALARAWRRGGNDRRALEYFRRAKALAPGDPEVMAAYENIARVYGHTVAVEGFGERLDGSHTASGSFFADVRVADPLRIRGRVRVQDRAGLTDTVAEGGVLWRATRSTTVDVRFGGGPDNASLPGRDASAAAIHYTGPFEIGGAVRRLVFSTADVIAVSPAAAWDRGERWRFDARYTYSHSSFSVTHDKSGDHSVLLRQTWRGWRRAALSGAYARGIESFEILTADRVRALGATTLAAGARIALPSLTAVATTWEHQWRPNSVTLDRFTVAIVQSFP